ncbi:MAG TPA: DUF3783 domain-containing protein [Clostridiaceae bacterium]|nr:DUF3783 domain-containing protein [Clostridiaceae bacterium]
MSIISDVEKQLVYYIHPDAEHAITKQINMKEFGKRHNVKLTFAGAEDVSRQFGEISGIAQELGVQLQPDTYTSDNPLPETDLILICGFDGDDRNQLLQDLQAEEVGRNALKAMATDTNIHWTLRHILTDVAEEHVIVQAYMDLRETVRIGEIVTETTGLPPRAKEAFTQRMELAQKIMASKQIPNEPDLMRRLANELKILMTMDDEEG